MASSDTPEPGHAGRVLVTGGAGFIGATLIRMLLQRGWAVTVLDDFSVGARDRLADLPVQIIEGNILDSATVREAIRGHQAVVHLAAQTGVPISLDDPRRDCEINVLGTLNVLEGCREEQQALANQGGAHGAPRMVLASSNAPLGRQTPPVTEDMAPLPVSPYGASKLACEGYCLAYNGSWGLGTVVLRFANVYGPYSTHKSSVVAKFMKDVLEGRGITIHGDGTQTRDFIHVSDLSRAVICALESEASGEVFQIATGIETSIRELAALLQDVAGRDLNIDHGDSRQGDVDRNVSVVAKARDVLGWAPQISLVDGLKDTWDWWVNSGPVSRGAR
ncbi:MAG: NAD-dependent epimerase/dehydratase family protein [Chloroflexota bacterium]